MSDNPKTTIEITATGWRGEYGEPNYGQCPAPVLCLEDDEELNVSALHMIITRGDERFTYMFKVGSYDSREVRNAAGEWEEEEPRPVKVSRAHEMLASQLRGLHKG